MIIYYFIWFVMSFLAFPFSLGKYKKILIHTLYFLLLIFVGLRFEVGGDWKSYINKYIEYGYIQNFNDFIALSEPAYGVLNILSSKLDIQDTILVNFICALIFLICFYKFSKRIGNYFFPLFVCFTYTIIVVTTGYTRQSVAIGFSLLAFISMMDKKTLSFILYIFIGALFHKSILVFSILLPFSSKLFLSTKNYIVVSYGFFSLFFMTVILYYASLSEQNAYVDFDSEMTSGGVYMRLLMHVVPVFYYLYYRSTFKKEIQNYKLLDFLVLVIIYTFFLASILSTLADRLNLFLVFFDLFVLTFIFNKVSIKSKILMWSLVFFSNTVVLTLWLSWGKWTQIFWIPYKNYISEFLMSVF